MNNPATLTSEAPSDIVLLELAAPPSVSMWPDTPAWYLLSGFLCLLFIVWFWRKLRAYRRDAWRREALILASQSHKSGLADEWFRLIKRVYLVHNDKPQLNLLSESELLSRITSLNPLISKALIQAHYRKDNCLPPASNDDLYLAFVHWVKTLPPTC